MKAKAVKLGDLLEVQNGFAFKKEFFSDVEGKPLIRIRDIDKGSTEAFYAGEYREEFLVYEGDYLIGMDGAFTCRKWTGPEALLNQRVCRLRNFSARVLPEYVFFGIQPALTAIEGTTSFVTVKHISGKQILDIELPLPDIQEQQRIVDILSRAEGIVRLRRAAQQKAAKLVPAVFVSMFGDPASNPKGWTVKTLIELTKFQSGGTPPKSREDHWIGTLPWVSPKDMKVVEISDSIDHVSAAVLTETNLKLVPVGSLLIVVRGMILVHTVPVAQTLVPVVINQDMKALIPNAAVDSSYLLWALKVQHVRMLALVDTAAHGTKKLDTPKIEALKIPVPPIETQRLFKRRADDVVSIVCQQAAATVKAKATFDALLSRAFSSGR